MHLVFCANACDGIVNRGHATPFILGHLPRKSFAGADFSQGPSAGQPTMTQQTIHMAVLRARQGEEAAFRTLYDQHVAMVFGYCLRFCRGDREAAMDLCQQSFLQAFQELPALRDPAAFPAWLKTTTRRCCLAWIDKRRRERDAMLRLRQEQPSPSQSPRWVSPENKSSVVAGVIAACPDKSLRETASMFYLEPGHSTAQIATAMGITQTAVTTRLMRFRKWARRRMLQRLASALEEAP